MNLKRLLLGVRYYITYVCIIILKWYVNWARNCIRLEFSQHLVFMGSCSVQGFSMRLWNIMIVCIACCRLKLYWVVLSYVAISASGLLSLNLSAWCSQCQLDSVLARKVPLCTLQAAAETFCRTCFRNMTRMRLRKERYVILIISFWLLFLSREFVSGCLQRSLWCPLLISSCNVISYIHIILICS